MNPDLGFLQLEIRVGCVCVREKQTERQTQRERGNSHWILNIECHLKSQEHDNKYINKYKYI